MCCLFKNGTLIHPKLAFPGISGGIFSRESGTGEIFHREDFSRNIKKIKIHFIFSYESYGILYLLTCDVYLF